MKEEKVKKEKIDAGEDLDATKEISKKILYGEITDVIDRDSHRKHPLDNKEIAEVLHDRYDDLLYDIELDEKRIHEYGESRQGICSEAYDLAKTAAKNARMDLYNSINTAIALYGEGSGMSHGEILGILELVKLQYFIEKKEEINQKRYT